MIWEMDREQLYHPYIVGERIYLRGLEKSDILGNWFGWFNDPEITYYMPNGERPNSYESLEEYYLKIQNSDSDFLFAIIAKQDNEHIGNCGLHDFDPIHRKARLGIVIGEKKSQNQGLGLEAVRLLIRYGFEILNLNRIYLNVNSENVNAIRIYKETGFCEEGHLKEDMYKNGKYYDVIVMGILKEEFREIERKGK